MEEIKAVPRREECDKNISGISRIYMLLMISGRKITNCWRKVSRSLLPMKEDWEKGFIRFWNI